MTNAGPRGGTGVETTATKSTHETTPRYLDVETPAALRRRRAASYRKPLLNSGFRDPLDELARGWPPDAEASRAAWLHLDGLGLMSELVERVLGELAGAA
jgi:hypothetical protein